MKRALITILAVTAACGSGATSAIDAGAPGPDAPPAPDAGPCPFGPGGVCAGCVEEKCRDLLDACGGNADCACMAACLGERGVGGIDQCLADLGHADRPPGFASLENCVAVACPDGDECSTPPGWTPADGEVLCDGSAAGLGGGSLPDCSFDTGLVFDPQGTIQQLQSVDGSICVRVERRNDGPGSLANTQWTLIDIRVGPLGQVALIDDTDACWYASHHNFRDWVHAWSGTRHFDLAFKQDGHGGARTYELYVFEQGPVAPASCASTADGTMCIDGPIPLVPVNP